MMACCIIAAYLYARLVDVLRRWCIFWGLGRRGPDDPAMPTMIGLLMRRGERPATSTVIITMVLAGSVGLLAVDHGRSPDSGGADSRVPRLSELVARIRP